MLLLLYCCWCIWERERYRKSECLSSTKVSTQTTQRSILWRPGPAPPWPAGHRAASEVTVEFWAVFLAAETVLNGKEETPVGQAPSPPPGLLGSRTTSSLAPLDIDVCTLSCLSWCFLSLQDSLKRKSVIRYLINLHLSACTYCCEIIHSSATESQGSKCGKLNSLLKYIKFLSNVFKEIVKTKTYKQESKSE